MILLAVLMFQVTAPGGQVIDVNPALVVTTRNVRESDKENFSRGVRCLIHTNDGKYIQAIETCVEVRRRMQ